MPLQRRSFRLTRGGWALLALSLLLAVGALNAALNMTYLLASLVTTVFLVSLILPFWNLRRVVCRRAIPEVPFAREPFEVRLTLSSKGRSAARLVAVEEPLAASAEGGGGPARKLALDVPARGHVRFACMARPLKRGVHKLPDLRWASRFPFGVAERAVRKRSEDVLLVYPARGRLSAGISSSLRPRGAQLGAVSRFGLRGNEFRSLREFHSGDNPRHIHWRVSARLNKLHVREMERERSSSVTVLLDSRIPASTSAAEKGNAADALELAVSFAAEVCRVALALGSPVRLVGLFPKPEIITARPEQGAMRSVYEALARLSPSQSEEADELAAASHEAGAASAWRAIAVTPTSLSALALRKSLDMRGVRLYVASDPGFSSAFSQPYGGETS